MKPIQQHNSAISSADILVCEQRFFYTMLRYMQRFADRNVCATITAFGCFLFTAITFNSAPILAQTILPCDSTIKQVLFVIDVSGSMETNDRLAEVKQFALRTVRERSKEKLLFKLISYGGLCNDVQTDVDWTRDAAVINAGIKGLYLRGGTPLGSALEFMIDNVKKSAYPDQTLILLLNDGANGCGSVQDILSQRIREIPCVRINVLGIELQDDENNLAERALADAEAISKATGGRFLPMNDVRELQGVSIADTGVTVRPVAFAPRKKVVKEVAKDSSASATTASSQTTPKKDTAQTLASNTRAEEKPQTANNQTANNQTANNQGTSNQESSSQSAQTKENRSTQPVRETSPETSSQTTRSSRQGQTQQSSNSQAEQPPKTEQQSKTEQSNSSKNKTSTKPTKQVAVKQSQRVSAPSQANFSQANTSQANSSQASMYTPFKDSTQSTDAGAMEEGIIVFYTPNSAGLLPQMKQGLERLVERLRQSGTSIQTIVVEGHSSIEGSSATNLRLSVERASSVAAFLQMQLRLPRERIIWNAFGEVRPVATNTTEAGRQENRRVEVRVIRYTQRAQ